LRQLLDFHVISSPLIHCQFFVLGDLSRFKKQDNSLFSDRALAFLVALRITEEILFRSSPSPFLWNRRSSAEFCYFSFFRLSGAEIYS